MKKAFGLIRLSFAMALCAIGLTTPAWADDTPGGISASQAGPPAGASSQLLSLYDVIQGTATRVATSPKASNEGPVGATPAPRAAPQPRSYPRTFNTYEALIGYASDVAIRQEASNQRLAQVTLREEATAAALAEVFDPLLRGGLLRSRTDVMDDTTLNSLRAQLANDEATRRQLVADGAVARIATTGAWQLPLVGENTQDFGPTPFWFEPPLSYQGVYYPNFHTGVDIAAPWGTPIVAPASGVVTFAGTMGDGAEVVVIAHDSGLVSMYAHLENSTFPVPVKPGDTVQAGDRIGYVGVTGLTTGPHVHWSVWRNGELIDALSMITK